jgi:hypothetical protein
MASLSVCATNFWCMYMDDFEGSCAIVLASSRVMPVNIASTAWKRPATLWPVTSNSREMAAMSLISWVVYWFELPPRCAFLSIVLSTCVAAVRSDGAPP